MALGTTFFYTYIHSKEYRQSRVQIQVPNKNDTETPLDTFVYLTTTRDLEPPRRPPSSRRNSSRRPGNWRTPRHKALSNRSSHHLQRDGSESNKDLGRRQSSLRTCPGSDQNRMMARPCQASNTQPLCPHTEAANDPSPRRPTPCRLESLSLIHQAQSRRDGGTTAREQLGLRLTS
jgi:hypothetical protein